MWMRGRFGCVSYFSTSKGYCKVTVLLYYRLVTKSINTVMYLVQTTLCDLLYGTVVLFNTKY